MFPTVEDIAGEFTASQSRRIVRQLRFDHEARRLHIYQLDSAGPWKVYLPNANRDLDPATYSRKRWRKLAVR